MSKFFNLSTREGYGKFVSVTGICVNILISAVKFAVALISGSISILADAFNNLSDAATSVIMLAGFHMAAKPADEEHPFGHGRVEYLAGLFVATSMIFVGGKLLITSVEKIISPEAMDAGLMTLFVMSVSIVAKFLLAMFYRRAAKKINSETIHAAVIDSFTDCLATGAIIISIVLWIKFDINIDGGAGIFVSAFILRGGFESLKEILTPIIGGKADPELLDGIKKIVTESPDVIDVHDLIVHSYGAKKFFVSMHVELPATLTLLEAHEIIDRLERKLQATFGVYVTLHVDPVVQGDAAFDEHRALAEKILAEISADLSMHDFRVVPYKSGRKLIFDVDVPQNFPMSDRELRREFQRRLIAQHADDRAIIHLDHQYC